MVRASTTRKVAVISECAGLGRWVADVITAGDEREARLGLPHDLWLAWAMGDLSIYTVPLTRDLAGAYLARVAAEEVAKRATGAARRARQELAYGDWAALDALADRAVATYEALGAAEGAAILDAIPA